MTYWQCIITTPSCVWKFSHTTTAPRVLNEMECLSGEKWKKNLWKIDFLYHCHFRFIFFFLHTLMLLTQNFFVVFSSPLHSSVEIPQVLRSVGNRDFVTWLECQKEKRDERRSTKKVWRLKDVGAIINYVTCEAFLDFSSTPWSSWILNTHL